MGAQVSSLKKAPLNMGASCALAAGLRLANVTSALGTFLMAVLAAKDTVSESILANGYWEIRSPAQLSELAGRPRTALAPNGTFLDIGANLGFYSLLFAQHGYSVLAVEPMLMNRRAIETSLCLNPQLRRRVTLVPTALAASASAGPCVVRADDRSAGNGVLFCGGDEGTCARPVSRKGRNADAQNAAHMTLCEEVPIQTLDALLARMAPMLPLPLVAAKLDIEGAECNVLAGGASIFSSYRAAFVQERQTPHAEPSRPRTKTARAGSPRNTPLSPSQVEANRKHIKNCLRKLAATHGYAITSVASGQDGLDTNWILSASPRPHASAHAAVGAGAGGGAAAGGGPAAAAAGCSGGTDRLCCRRHPRACSTLRS